MSALRNAACTFGANTLGVEGAGEIRQCVAAGAERGTHYVAQAFKARSVDVWEWAAFAQHVLYDGDRELAMVIACMGYLPKMSGNTKVTPIHHACSFYSKSSR